MAIQHNGTAHNDQDTPLSLYGMRRVASAPAFKHAGAYGSAASPAAALAEALAAADAEAAAAAAADAAVTGSTHGTSRRSNSTWQPARPSGIAAVTAAQQLLCGSCAPGRCSCLEVYVVSRPFNESGGPLLRSMNTHLKEHMVDLGISHYLTVFKTSDGELVQFDFGPQGGDVRKAHGPMGDLMRAAANAAAAVAAGGAVAAQESSDQASMLTAAGSCGGGTVSTRATSSTASSSGSDASAAAAATAAATITTAVNPSPHRLVHSPSAPVLPAMPATSILPGAAPTIGSDDDCASSSGSSSSSRPLPCGGDGSGGGSSSSKGVPGEIRERLLSEMPPACMYVGRTRLSLSDIRRYNAAQGRMTYTLHDNDCRHYVNGLVAYTTGVERSTQHLKRHYFASRTAERWVWYGCLISVTQLITDVGNWGHVQAGAAATLLLVSGRSTLAQFKSVAAPALSRMLPALLGPAAGGMSTSALAASLKLPTALMLMKRPVAGSVAAAGGAGAAAAVIRTAPTCAGITGDASAQRGSSSSRGGSGFTAAGLGVAVRPLRQVGDGLGAGVRGAVLSLRSAAVAARRQEGAAAAGAGLREAAAAAGSAPVVARRWLFGGRGAAAQQQIAGRFPAATAALPELQQDSMKSLLVPLQQQQQHQQQHRHHQQQHQQQQQRHAAAAAGLGQHVGRHVMWLGSTAARATTAAALLASRHAGHLFTFGRPSSVNGVTAPHAPLSTSSPAASGGARTSGFGTRCRSTRSTTEKSLAVVAAPAGCVGIMPVREQQAASAAAAAAVSQQQHSSAVPLPAALAAVADCLPPGNAASSYNKNLGEPCGRPAGGASAGRQVLHLPVPRLTWARRCSQAVVAAQ